MHHRRTMKPVTAFSLVVIAVLATVVVEETRIKKLQQELLDLRALRAAESRTPATASTPSESPAETPAAAPAESPAPAPSTDEAAPLPPRQLPPDYPEPAVDRIRQLALGDRANLYLELGLTSREQAYLEDVIAEWKSTRARLCGEWLQATTEERAARMQEIQQIEEAAMDTLRAFFGEGEEFQRVMNHLAAQPEREMVRQMTPLMDAKGIALERAKEEQLIEALFRLRDVVGGIDWSSPAALEFMADGTARDRFTASWQKASEALPDLLKTFLSTDEAAAVVEARESLRDGMLEALPAPPAQ